MKILLATDTIGGVWTYAIELARALQSHDVQVLLATMGAPVNDSQRFQAEALQNVQLIESSFKLEWMPDPWDDVREAGDWLLKLEQDHRPDVIHLNGFAHGALPWSAPVLMVGHSCVCSWWKAVKGEPAPTEWDVYRDAVKTGLRQADLVVAPSRAMLEALVDHYGPLPRARVIYNGRDAGPFCAGEKEPFVLSAGRLWDAAKNVSALQQIAPRLPWRVYVAGDESHPDGQSATAGAANLHALGRLTEPQLAGWMSRAAIYALPARYEPFGLSALEAALSGCALVLGDIDTLREIWGEAALYVPPDDVQQLSRTLNALVADPSLCATMASRAQARASRYTLGRMGQQYRDVYTMLLDQQFNGRITHERETGRAGPNQNPDAYVIGDRMRIVMFYHSLLSDWNHGNAHFLRGIVSELLSRDHDVRVYEPGDAWSVQNLLAEYGEEPIRQFERAYPALRSIQYDLKSLDLDAALDGADLVLVHEWNDHDLVRRVGQHRARCRRYRLLFHDTHHRALTAPEQMAAYDLSHYDGVLAYGKVLRDLYLDRGWTRAAWTWHEAADTRVFRPLTDVAAEGDLVWVGNWGDEERTAELHEFLLNPVKQLKLKARVHGVRYPDHARTALANAGIEYAGWLPNFQAPQVFAAHKVTVHVPRRPYVEALRGIPTIRPFEALACGIPLVCSPWEDAEGLFTPRRDYLIARDGAEMTRHLRTLVNEPQVAEEIVAHGLHTIRSRHTCAHRVDELLKICEELDPQIPQIAQMKTKPPTPSLQSVQSA